MKLTHTIFVVIFLPFLMSTQANAKESNTAHAIEHTAIAKGHGKAGHGKILYQHADKALEYAKKAEKEHADAHLHMTEGVKHLEEAKKHAKAGKNDVAANHAKEALIHIIKSASK